VARKQQEDPIETSANQIEDRINKIESQQEGLKEQIEGLEDDKVKLIQAWELLMERTWE
jgi:chaperonin cofactor prefoldin